MIPKYRAYVYDEMFKRSYVGRVTTINYVLKDRTSVIVENVGVEDPTEYTAWYDVDKIKLMQSTGIQDVNGVEIYEGDIVKLKYPYDKRLNMLAVVKRHEDKACFALDGAGRLTTELIELHRVTANHRMQVIGNIYENKDLLEENGRCLN